MINLSNEVKQAYQRDRTDINLVVQFSDDIPTINNSSLLIESMSFSEILTDESQLKFGGCNSARFEVTIINPNENISNGVTITPYIEIKGIEGSRIDLGTFTITDMQKSKDNPYTHIVALDKLQLLNTDVTGWYNSLSFPMTVKAYRDSFFSYFGIEQETVTLPMDNLQINRLYTSEALNGLVVARDICEANGRFGRMGRDGKFEYVKLGSVLFDSTDVTPYLKEKASFNTFLTQFVDGIKVMSSDGTLYRQKTDAKNEYVVTSGLFNNKTETELANMCSILLDEIKDISYQPINDLVMKSLPYIENGDNIKFLSGGSYIYSYALTREIEGIKSLTDTICSFGIEKLVYDENSLQNQLLKLERDEEQLKIDVSATREGLSFKVDKTAYEQYQGEVANQFSQTTKQIENVDSKFSSYSTTKQMETAIKQSADNITQSVANTYATKSYVQTVDGKFNNYSTTSQMNSAIKQSADSVKLEVSKTYATQESVSDVNDKFSDYSTTEQMNSAIKTSADAITQEVSKTYATQQSVKDVDNKFNNYSTTTQMNSAIQQSANSIKSEVSQTYATNEYVNNKVDKEDYMEYQNTIQSQFEQTANDIQISFSQSVQDAKDYTDNQTSDTTTGFQELMTYIKLDSNGITIGKSENRLTLQLSNDAILFLNDGQPIGSWDGTNFHTGNIVIDVNQRAQFGNFAYVPRSDGSLMFLKVK